MKKIFIIIPLSFLFMSGCRTIYCSNQYITPAFIGFSPTDLDTLVVREYKQNDNFKHLIDTALIVTSPGVNAYNTSSDTTIVVLNVLSGEEKYLMPGFDWQIFIPSKDRTISITNIITTQTERSCFGDICGCGNPIDSLILEGKTKYPQFGSITNYGNGYLTYINNN